MRDLSRPNKYDSESPRESLCPLYGSTERYLSTVLPMDTVFVFNFGKKPDCPHKLATDLYNSGVSKT